MVKSKVVYDSVPPADNPLSVGVASVEMQGVSIDPNDLSGPVALRLYYDAYTDQFYALYALDGGGAWNLLGDPMQSTFSTSIAGTAAHGLYADPMFEPASVPEAHPAILSAIAFLGLCLAKRRSGALRGGCPSRT